MNDEQRVIDLIPSGWFKDRGKSSVWVRCYWARPIVKPPFTNNFAIELARSILVFFQGSVTFSYADRPDIEPTMDRDARFRTPKRYGQATTPPGIYAFTIAPHDVNGTEAREDVTEAQMDELEGLLTSYGGRATVYQRVFDNICNLGDNSVTIYFGKVDNPAWYDSPDLSPPGVASLAAVDLARLRVSQDVRSRVDLSLRWLAYAGRDHGVDAFIKYWVAIETLTMPDDTNVRPANELLASRYGISLDQATRRFSLGRLQGVRSAIIHRGLRVEIPGEVAKFMEGVYFDLLTGVLRVSAAPRAQAFIKQGAFEMDQWLTRVAASA